MTDNPRLTIGLTGGIASGKTAVSERLRALGAAVVDTDVVARDVVAPGSPGLAAIAEQFGNEFIDASGNLDRVRMRDLVFRDPAQRAALESITHPLIRERCMQLARETQGPYLVFVVPLLVGSSFVALLDRVLVVDCPRELQLQRLMARDDESAEAAQRILAAQVDRQSLLAIADDVIVNDADLATLSQKTDALHAFYLQLARSHRAVQPAG